MIPDFQTLMLPFLKTVQDGREYSTKDLIAVLAIDFKLTEEDINQSLPSGTQKTFHNRIYWTKSHLKMAGLIEDVRRGYFKITAEGQSVLKQNPEKINLRFLKQIPTYREWTSHLKDDINKEASDESTPEELETPEEIITRNFLEIRKNLAMELLSKIKEITPSSFEYLVLELLVKMGYGGAIKDAGKVVGRSGDEGIDVIIKEDKLGLETIYIQAKKWEGVVGRPEIQKFVGALAGQGAKKGIFITTSRFTKEAEAYQPRSDTKIVLIDGEQLAEYMIDYDLAVSHVKNFIIKRIDSDYFDGME
jgi:restriction system protein